MQKNKATPAYPNGVNEATKRAYSTAAWAADFTAAFAPVHARGRLLAADNQEPEPAPFNPLLIDGVEHDALCLKVMRAPWKQCTCGAAPEPGDLTPEQIDEAFLEAVALARHQDKVSGELFRREQERALRLDQQIRPYPWGV